ncbi:MAG: ABC transporter ATP-binding protein [Parvularculaceae bacterium]
MRSPMGLVLRNIRHSFGAGLVVDGASLEAAPGEIVTLFGPSGCGKTTLLRIAAGLEKLQDGAVELDAATLASAQKHTPPEIRPIGFVFQDYVLFPHMSVAENVAFGLAGHARAERAARVAAELGAVGISELSDRYPHQLSGGQQQRVALARAFARQPRAMLLDEPFASIDVALRRRLRAEMRRILKARSTTTVLVTHDPADAVEIGDRIAVMRAGRIVETGSPEQLYAAPKTVAAASVYFPARKRSPAAPSIKGSPPNSARSPSNAGRLTPPLSSFTKARRRLSPTKTDPAGSSIAVSPGRAGRRALSSTAPKRR